MLLRLGSWKNILSFLGMFFSRKLGRVGWKMELLLEGHKLETSFFTHNRRGWAEDGWVSAFPAKSENDKLWVSLGEILSAHWKAASVPLLKIIQNVFLTGWTHSLWGANTAPVERVARSPVGTLACQRTVRSVLAWPAFCEEKIINIKVIQICLSIT